MRLSPRLSRLILNLYPPYLGAGVKTEYFSDDWRTAQVSMKLRWYNKNAVRTHFGGSLYAMVDPHLMLMLMNIMGRGYNVMDQMAAIEYIKPGLGRVHADIVITDQDLATIHASTENGQKYLHTFTILVKNEQDEIVCRVKKTLYVRQKRQQA